MPSESAVTAVDINGNGLVTGDLVTLRARVEGGAGGVGMVVLRLLSPATVSPFTVDTVRSGAFKADNIIVDGNLIKRD